MITVYTDRHRLHHARGELNDGELMPAFEKPERIDTVLERVRETGLGKVTEPLVFGRQPLARVHSSRFLDFLENAWSQWTALHGDTDALPLAWPTRGLRDVEPEHIDGRLGYYSFDAGTPITAGTWQAITAAADVALTAAARLTAGDDAAFALCRPPGHHAGSDFFGGYCFLNNAGIAAQYLRDQGSERVAILDVDYHHGNGTQELFYERDDVFFCSIHADPRQEYPFFLGHADETGQAEGEGCNLNLPLPTGSGWQPWSAALDRGLEAISRFAPASLVVSLGVDTFEGDPISAFRLRSQHYPQIGSRIAGLSLPTLFVMEGGYAVAEIGVNTVNVLEGFRRD